MKNIQLNKEDFTYTANKGGYMLYYKNNPIGGAGTMSKGNNIRGKGVMKQINDYAKMAKTDIENIINGGGYPNMLEQIKLIG